MQNEIASLLNFDDIDLKIKWIISDKTIVLLKKFFLKNLSVRFLPIPFSPPGLVKKYFFYRLLISIV